jgi:phenylpropionate dioxygenase-like ring-hydroxylating dioxygenase large terminal subunit
MDAALPRNTRTVIPASYFHDDAVFAREQRVLMQNTWQFFCLKTDLLNDNDFVAQSVGGIPVVVQNFKGRLVAMHNVCSHRYSPIQTACSGNRQLACPYHGWKFCDKGVPIGIPHNLEFYPIAREDKPLHALKRFQVETCGNLVFVAIAAQRTLREQLGEWHEIVEKIGTSVDDIYFTTSMPAECNWKFVVHNAFDDIHAEFVHPSASLDTSVYTGAHWKFHPFVADAESSIDDYSKRHAQLNVGMDAATVRRNETLWEPRFPDRAFKFDDYLHLFLFPNLIITSVQGFWYNIVRYKPISATQSEMTNWLVPAKPMSGESRVTPELLYRIAIGSMRIFSEDVRAVEVSQAVIGSVSRPGVLGRREDKIASFEAAYMNVMESDELEARTA